MGLVLPFCASLALASPIKNPSAPFVILGDNASHIFSLRNAPLERIELGNMPGLVTVVELYNKKTKTLSYNIFHITEKSCRNGKGTAHLTAIKGGAEIQMDFVVGQEDATSLIAGVMCLMNTKEKSAEKRGDQRPDDKLNVI